MKSREASGTCNYTMEVTAFAANLPRNKRWNTITYQCWESHGDGHYRVDWSACSDDSDKSSAHIPSHRVTTSCEGNRILLAKSSARKISQCRLEIRFWFTNSTRPRPCRIDAAAAEGYIGTATVTDSYDCT